MANRGKKLSKQNKMSKKKTLNYTDNNGEEEKTFTFG